MAQPNSPDMPPKCTTKVQLQNFEVTAVHVSVCKMLDLVISFMNQNKNKNKPSRVGSMDWKSLTNAGHI